MKVLLSLLQVCESSPLDRTQLEKLGEILTDCYQAVWAYHAGQVLDKDLGILQLKLLLWCSSRDHFADLAVGDVTAEESTVGLLKACLRDGYPLALRTFCLEFINTTTATVDIFSDDVTTEHVFTSLCSESDPDYLIQVCHIPTFLIYFYVTCNCVLHHQRSIGYCLALHYSGRGYQLLETSMR